jgi:hypothetical protein
MPNENGLQAETAGASLQQRRRDAIWKWRWLGFRDSTPAFKASLVLLIAVFFALVTYVEIYLH